MEGAAGTKIPRLDKFRYIIPWSKVILCLDLAWEHTQSKKQSNKMSGGTKSEKGLGVSNIGVFRK